MYNLKWYNSKKIKGEESIDKMARKEKKIEEMSKEELKEYKAKLKADKKKAKQEAKANRKKLEIKDIVRIVVVALLCLMMLLSVCGTLLYYIVKWGKINVWKF